MEGHPKKQGLEQSASEPKKIDASTPYDFNGRNLTPCGGLLPCFGVAGVKADGGAVGGGDVEGRVASFGDDDSGALGGGQTNGVSAGSI
jgi:hypothetical protein